MKKITSFLIASIIISMSSFATGYEYKYRLTLKDKGNSEYSIENPQKFLSQKAIDRRIKHSIKLDDLDLPISKTYLSNIESTGAIIVAKSKWNNTVAVHVKDSLQKDVLSSLPFVENIELVWRGKIEEKTLKTDTTEHYPIETDIYSINFYGEAYDNIRIFNGEILHENGYMGEGITIGVIDAGFNNAPKIEYLDNINLLGHKSFVYKTNNLFEHENQHGLNVISCIATNRPHQFVGTAPNADFWMLGSEDSASEYPIEEDYWAAAIEFADSVGIDVINTSLGYTRFDTPIGGYTRDVLDGKTALISKSATIAAKKGMLLVVSAGNAGDQEWEKVSVPADAYGILTVGAVAKDSTLAAFSSYGLTSDLRIKPEVVALGVKSAVIDEKGLIAFRNGTSFSSPIMCGIAACLWQAFPTLSNYELIDIIKESADRYDDPSLKYGYGIPNMEKAMEIGKIITERKEKIKQRKEREH